MSNHNKLPMDAENSEVWSFARIGYAFFTPFWPVLDFGLAYYGSDKAVLPRVFSYQYKLTVPYSIAT